MANFYNVFLTAAGQNSNRIAVELQRQSGEGEHWTYSVLRARAEAIAQYLVEEHERGTRCAILAANSPQWVVTYLGILAAGCVAVPLDTAFKPEQVHKLLADCGAALLFADEYHLPAAEQAAAGIPVLPIEGAPEPDPNAQRQLPIARDDSDTAVILYTSGTTSDPKGVMLSHANLAAEAAAVFSFIKVTPQDSVLAVLPLFHALAQMANLLLPLTAGGRVVYLESLNTRELMRALAERDITLFCCVPQFFYLIHKRILHEVEQRGALATKAFRALLSLCGAARKIGLNPGRTLFRRAHEALGKRMRYLISGGSRFDPQIARELHAMGFEILQAYGLTETSGGATCTPPRHNVLGSVGRPFKGIELKIASDERGCPTLTAPAVGAVGWAASEESTGEVLLRGGIVMKGYYNRPDATAEAIRDGWLHTGDLGYTDSAGNLFITGRRKEIIVLASGKNIYPEEIETHYEKSPWIKEVCVLGVQGRPGEPASEKLHAIIVPDFDVLRAKRIVNASEMVRFDMDSLSSQLPATKRVLSYELWQDELPRTTTRKLKRFEIERLFKARASVGPGVSPGQATPSGATGSRTGASTPGRSTGPQADEVERSAQSASALGTDEAIAIPARQFTSEDLAWLDGPEVTIALDVVRNASNLKKEDIHPADSLELDLGLDSMERVELLVELEQALGTQVPDSVASEVYTVREMIDAVRSGQRLENVGPAAIGRSAAAGGAQNWDKLLSEPPSPEDLASLSAPRRISAPLWYFATRLINMFARDLFKLEVSGLEKLPSDGPFIVCPNHQSFLDPPVVVSVLPWTIFRLMFSVGTSEIFGGAIGRRIAHSFRLFPVDPDRNLIPAMRIGAAGLRHGKVLVLYPEGERSIDGSPKRFKKGAAILATHMQVPIVPIAIDGFFDAWPRGQSLPQRFAKLKLAICDPLLPQPLTAAPEQEYDRVIQEVRNRIVAKWEQLHGAKPPEPAARKNTAGA